MMSLRSILESRGEGAPRRTSRLSRHGRETFRPALMTPMPFSRRAERTGEPLGADVAERLAAMPTSTASDVKDACDEGFGASR